MANFNEELTQKYIKEIEEILREKEEYEAIKTITGNYLGSRKVGENQVLFGYWSPGVKEGRLKDQIDHFDLEIFSPKEELDIPKLKKKEEKEFKFHLDKIKMKPVDEYLVAVVDHVKIGDGEDIGAFYWLKYHYNDRSYIVRDPLVKSMPLGIYAPGEVFDFEGMLINDRGGSKYYRSYYKRINPDGSYKAKDVGSHLEIHTETATKEGTLAALTRKYKDIAAVIKENIDNGEEDIYKGLSVADYNFIGFDSIELTPEVPPAEREAVKNQSGEFFNIVGDNEGGEVSVKIKRPDISNWGYDTPIVGSAAVNPSILETLRPNELVEFIRTIHAMPDKPIQLCIDSVLGHCDFQGAKMLQTFEREPDTEDLRYIKSKYLKGPNMYGRDIDFTNLNVKAILLELLIQKINYGFDCIRVDGAQDFVLDINESTGLRIQDDEFLNELANITQDVNGLKRKLDINLEDGRPWPDDLNWLYNSKYLDHCIERELNFKQRVKQWSPIIFAHNVHGKFKWFMDKWDRFVEVYRYGENWITGHSNHDNARYFYKMVEMKPSSYYEDGDDYSDYYNSQLGETMTDVAHNALDNNALTALMLGYLPGNPLFLLNALFHTPWIFLRDIDDSYDVQILAEEASRFFIWYVGKELFEEEGNFPRLKAYGFNKFEDLVNEDKTGFLDALYYLFSKVKTDAVAVRYLFDSVDDAGGYENVNELMSVYESISNPQTMQEKEHRGLLETRAEADPIDVKRRIKLARKLFDKSMRFLQRDLKHKKNPAIIKDIENQIDKIEFLQSIKDKNLGLLLNHSAYIDEYNVETWAKNTHLNAAAPDSMKEKGVITAKKLKEFSKQFMYDAKDVLNVSKYEDRLSEAQVMFNFTLRMYRRKNSWLLKNPTNDVKLDYFARKLFINGAKDTGDWGDKGDKTNCNTIYYGWRTSPDQHKQVFFIGNMEGEPIEECPLDLFLNLSGEWRVIAKSPTLEGIPEVIDKTFIIKNFKNGETILAERVL